MSIVETQKCQLAKIVEHRDAIVNNLFHIEKIFKQYFPEEFDIAYQHWIPQIMTALYSDTRWLNRGEYSLQDSMKRILDHNNDVSSGNSIKRYI